MYNHKVTRREFSKKVKESVMGLASLVTFYRRKDDLGMLTGLIEYTVQEALPILKTEIIKRNNTFPLRIRKENGEMETITAYRAEAYSDSLRSTVLFQYSHNLDGKEILFVNFYYSKYGLISVSDKLSKIIDIQVFEGGKNGLVDGDPENVSLHETISEILYGGETPPIIIKSKNIPFILYRNDVKVKREIDNLYHLVLRESARYFTKDTKF